MLRQIPGFNQLAYTLNPGGWDLLLSCPSAGTGVHRWIFSIACALSKVIRDDELIYDVIAVASIECGREVPEREIRDAIANSRRIGEKGGGCSTRRTGRRQQVHRWPARNLQQILAIGSSSLTLAELRALSPVLLDGHADLQTQIIDLLFPGDPLLCLGANLWRFETMAKSRWMGLVAELQFIVPSPMSAKFGRKKDGNISERSLENTGPRRFLVVEFDFQAEDKEGNATPDAPVIAELERLGRTVKDLCAALALHLAEYAPLVLVADSGGKSLHAWFYCLGVGEEHLRRFMAYAVSLGADPMTFTPCQFVRLPGGLRENGNRQVVLYFKPELLQEGGI